MTITGATSPIGAQDTVVVEDGPGKAFVPAAAPLIGLNYFDGRFLRADDLNLERRGQRTYVELSNQARGGGVAWGFDVGGLDTDTLTVSSGLALDHPGRVLHLPIGVTAKVSELLAATAAPTTVSPEPATTAFAPCAGTVAAAPVTVAVGGTSIYEICLSATTGLCGQAEVLGRLCDDGCVTASDRPYVVDGVRLLLRPLDPVLEKYLQDLGATSEVRKRSQVASAYFARELAEAGSPLSRAGLAGAVWSAGATPVAESAVPIGVLGWTGSTIVLLDAWTARRELVESAADRYWAGRVRRRPWSVFLAHVLQFQSQLIAPPPPVPDPAVPRRILLERGFVQLPSAGYLGIDLQRDLRAQLQDLMGPGVALRLCAVPSDQIPRELERAQHLERISLRHAELGLEPEQVDVLVPDGTVATRPGRRSGTGFAVDARAGAVPLTNVGSPLPLTGAARSDDAKAIDVRVAVAGTAAQGMPPLVTALVTAFLGSVQDVDDLARRRPQPTQPNIGLLRELGDAALIAGVRRRAGAGAVAALPRAVGQAVAAWATVSVDDDPFALAVNAETDVDAALDLTVPGDNAPAVAVRIRPAALRRLAGGTDREAVFELSGLLRVDELSLPGTPLSGSGDQGVIARLVLHRGSLGEHTWFAVTDEVRSVAVAVAWAGSPLVAHGAFARRRGDKEPDLAPLVAALTAADVFAALADLDDWLSPLAFTARADDTLARLRGPYYQAATAALAVLATDTHPDDPRYVADRRALLFPPEDDAVVSEVTAQQDWVLFRRRMRKECEGGPGVPPPGAVPVTAWVREEADEGAAKEVAAKLAAGDWPPTTAWGQTEVVFEPDRRDLLTPPLTWQKRYQDAGGGPHVHFAAYAAATPTLAATVGVDRVDALLDVLPPAATPDANANTGAVVAPGPYLLPHTDGSAFLVTYAATEPVVRVLAVVALDRNRTTAVKAAIEQGDAAVVANALPTFVRPGELTPQDPDLAGIVTELRKAFPTPPSTAVTAVLWVRPGLPTADRDALVALAGQMATAAEPVMVPTPAGIQVPPPLEVAPPVGLPDATLFLIPLVLN